MIDDDVLLKEWKQTFAPNFRAEAEFLLLSIWASEGVVWLALLQRKTKRPDDVPIKGKDTIGDRVAVLTKAGWVLAGDYVPRPTASPTNQGGPVQPLSVTARGAQLLDALRRLDSAKHERWKTWLEKQGPELDSDEVGSTPSESRRPPLVIQARAVKGSLPSWGRSRAFVIAAFLIGLGLVFAAVMAAFSDDSPERQATYTVRYDFQANVPFETFVTGCANITCQQLEERPYSVYLVSTGGPAEYDLINLFTKHGSKGNDTHIAYHHAHGYLPHLYRVQTSDDTYGGPHEVPIEFVRKSECPAHILDVVLQQSTEQLRVQYNLSSPWTRPPVTAAWQIHPDVQDWFGPATKVETRIVNATGNTTAALTEQIVHPLFGEKSAFTAFFAPLPPGDYELQLGVEIIDAACLVGGFAVHHEAFSV